MSVLQDKSEIVHVINLYGVALDSHAWDLLDEIFTADVHADFGPAGAVWKSLAALKFAFKDFHETLTNHMHTMTGSCVHVEGDKANALTYGDWLLSRDSAKGGRKGSASTNSRVCTAAILSTIGSALIRP